MIILTAFDNFWIPILTISNDRIEARLNPDPTKVHVSFYTQDELKHYYVIEVEKDRYLHWQYINEEGKETITLIAFRGKFDAEDLIYYLKQTSNPRLDDKFIVWLTSMEQLVTLDAKTIPQLKIKKLVLVRKTVVEKIKEFIGDVLVGIFD